MASSCPECGFWDGHAPTCQAAGVDLVAEFENVPTVREPLGTLERRCALCRGIVIVDDADPQPPDPDEAWALPGCTATRDTTKHHWCRTKGKLWLPTQGILAEYDRRRNSITVTHDRRRKDP